MVSKQFSINTCNARHELDLLKAICEQNKWQNVEQKNAKADMFWQFSLYEQESKSYPLTL